MPFISDWTYSLLMCNTDDPMSNTDDPMSK